MPNSPDQVGGSQETPINADFRVDKGSWQNSADVDAKRQAQQNPRGVLSKIARGLFRKNRPPTEPPTKTETPLQKQSREEGERRQREWNKAVRKADKHDKKTDELTDNLRIRGEKQKVKAERIQAEGDKEWKEMIERLEVK